MPLRRWVEGVWLNLGGPATLDSVTDLHNANTFFDLLDELDAGGDLRSRDEFIDRVDTLYASADVRADDSLQVMSIHKAKGLEFDHVILPGLSKRSRSDDTQLLLWSESPHQDHSDLLLAPVKASHEDSSPIYDFIRSLEKRKQHHEGGTLTVRGGYPGAQTTTPDRQRGGEQRRRIDKAPGQHLAGAVMACRRGVFPDTPGKPVAGGRGDSVTCRGSSRILATPERGLAVACTTTRGALDQGD